MQSPFKHNPIFKRLAMSPARPLGQFLAITFMLFLSLNLLCVFLSEVGLLDRFLTFIPIVAAPATLFSLFVVAGSAATLTARESQGEAFQLLRLTNIPARQVVWGYLGGIIFRTRHFIGLLVFAMPLSILWALVEVRREVPFPLNAAQTYPPNISEVIVLLWVSTILSACSIFVIIAAAISYTLRTRQAVRATLTTVSIAGIVFMGLMGMFVIWLVSETSDTGSIFIAAGLSASPYGIALIFAHYWESDPRRIAPILNTIPFSIVINAYFVLGGLSQTNTTLTFWVIFLLIAILLVRWIIIHQDSPLVPTRVGFLTWQAMMASVLMIGMGSNYRNERDVMLWMIIINLWLIQVAVGFQELGRATRYLWDERFYF